MSVLCIHLHVRTVHPSACPYCTSICMSVVVVFFSFCLFSCSFYTVFPFLTLPYGFFLFFLFSFLFQCPIYLIFSHSIFLVFRFSFFFFHFFSLFRATLPLLQMASEFLKYVPIVNSLPSYAINMLSYLNRSHFRSSSSS